MSELTVVPPGGGEVIGDSPERRVEILFEHDALHATWSRFGPRRDGADLHIHRTHSDFFYVLDGELTVRLGVEDVAMTVPSRALAHVPPLVVHGYRNASDADVVYLNFHAPGAGFADYLRGLGAGRRVPFDQEPPPPDGSRPTGDAAIGGAKPAGDGIMLLTDAAALGIAEVRVDPGASAPRSPLAPGRAQALYVLEGDLAVGEQHAPAGSWVALPHGAPRPVATERPARFLDLYAH
jgi:mannose-6-phosphate isomerase-like protein (cupin superfamily)